jgi:hypothetical protein
MQLKNGSQEAVSGLAAIEPEPGFMIVWVVPASP